MRASVFAVATFAAGFTARDVSAQGAAPIQMSMPMGPAAPLGISDSREGSGTSWLPDTSTMGGAMHEAGAWSLMWHGAAFLTATDANGPRGDHEIGSQNWLMGSAARAAGAGVLTLRAMVSLEPLTVGRCGYPDLLQTGELCRGEPIHDAQHPHDLFMEIAIDYRRALSHSLAFEIYGGPAGEPALGPVAFPHRPSAEGSPMAPISHHWLDSSHVSFGVVTGGLYGRRWKAEGSVFNGREPDDRRYGLDLAALDSYSGRLWWLPAPQWAIQVSAGRLKDAEATPEGSRESVTRTTASAAYHRLVGGHLWATTVAWGRNVEEGRASNAFLAETTAEMSADGLLFARGEFTGKTSTELVLPPSVTGDWTFPKVEVGYTRWLVRAAGMKWGVGAGAAVVLVPAQLSTTYGGRTPVQGSIFLTVR
jgi:hypothetical protein